MRFKILRNQLTALALILVLPLTACASKSAAPVAQTDDQNDPWENVNRPVFNANMKLDEYLMRPLAVAYRDGTPDLFQSGITNALHNLKTPEIMANDLLQGNMDRFGQSFARLWLNTVVGLGGLIDVGAKSKIPYHDSDFGQTLGVWGVEPGPYLVLPLLGPSDPRDGIGYGVDSYADPIGWKMRAAGDDDFSEVRGVLGVVAGRAAVIDDLDELKKSSLDFYAALRSLYQQKRAADVAAGRASPGTTTVPQTSYDLPADPPAKPATGTAE
jgi:phospholipid-binding lipoprotein MlaA